MSFSAGILAQAVWLCLNEVWVNGFQDMVLRGKTQKYVDTDQEDNVNGLRLEISPLWYADKNLIIRCNNLQSPRISGPMQPSGQCWSNVKLLLHIASTYKLVLSCRAVTFFWTDICSNKEAWIWFYFEDWGDAHVLLCIHTQTVMHIVLEVHTHIHTCTPLRCIHRLQSSQGSCWPRSIMVSAPADLHSKSMSALLEQPGAKKCTTNLVWNEILSLKNVCGFMRSMPWKLLKCTSIYKSAVNNKRKVGIYLKVLLNFQVSGVMDGLSRQCCWRELCQG